MGEQRKNLYSFQKTQYINNFRSIPIFVFILALSVRLILIPTSILRINPYATADATGFANRADLIAQQFLLGPFSYDLQFYSSTYDTWGLFLSPFWLLPGPSEIYAHIFVAILGSLAIYNVAIIGSNYHSPLAGLIATLPLCMYPSIALVHATLLREAAVLFCLTAFLRVIISRKDNKSTLQRWFVGLVFISIATVLRPENLLLYVGTIGFGLFVWLTIVKDNSLKYIIFASTPVVALIVFQQAESAINYIFSIRDYRAQGRSVYFSELPLDGIVDFVGFSWIGIAYFLYSPFVWMIQQPRDLIIGIESILSILLTITAIIGLPVAVREYPVKTGALIIGFLVGVAFYGFGTVNVGTAVRHRQMFLWIIFLFSGIGIANNFKIAS